jgi:hypothetical protein
MTDFDEREVSAAEADLERLLAIEPSPEFAAKVRGRIAAEPPARRWMWGRLVLPLAAAAALVIVLTLSSNWSARGPEQPVASSRQNDIVLSPPKPKEAPPVEPVTAMADVQPKIRRAPVPEQKPEIIIDPAVTDAIRRLAVAARNTMLDVSNGQSIAAPDSASDTLQVAEPLNVPELVLKPADQTGGQ